MKLKKTVYNITVAVLILIFAGSLFMIIRQLIIGNREKSEFENIAELVVTPVVGENDTQTSETGEEYAERDISAVLSQNSECIGWIYIGNTVINYPVMHTPDNPEKYLHLSFYGKYSYSGTPFLDSTCNADSCMNSIIYAHNMKNGTMFHQLKRYRNSAYTAENPIIEYQTANGIKKYRIFAVCDVEGNDSWYNFTGSVDENTYKAKIEYIKSKALFETGITPVYPQNLITLSTCRDGTDSGRLLVIGVEE